MGSGSVDNLKNNLSKTTESLNRRSEKLASGKRINRASDDAAGLAIADALAKDAVVYDQASRNIADGQSLTQIQDGVYSSLSDIGTRMQELAAQSANGTLSDTQRSSLNQEFQALSQEANRIVASTQFNGQQVFSGQSNTIQVGTDSSSTSQINVTDPGLAGVVASTSSVDISNQSNAQNAIGTISNFLSSVSQSRGELGASQSRLEVADNTAKIQRENSLAAESRIRDLDYAEEVAGRTADLIRQQANTGLIAQASKLSGDIVRRLLT